MALPATDVDHRPHVGHVENVDDPVGGDAARLRHGPVEHLGRLRVAPEIGEDVLAVDAGAGVQIGWPAAMPTRSY